MDPVPCWLRAWIAGSRGACWEADLLRSAALRLEGLPDIRETATTPGSSPAIRCSLILPTNQLRCVARLCVAGVLTASCAVPIRYAVPSEELYGREVIGQTLDFVDGDDIDKFRVVGA